MGPDSIAPLTIKNLLDNPQVSEYLLQVKKKKVNALIACH
jgi:hypothetical protein